MRRELPQMEALDAVVQTVVTSADDVVYISGSLIEGFGNAASDVDVFLITPRPRDYRGPFGTVLGDYYVDLEIYTAEQMHDLSARVGAVDPADFAGVWKLRQPDLDLYYRTLIGEACHNDGGFETLRGRFDRDTIARLIAVWCGLRYAASMQHAEEELAAGRLVNAVVACEAAAASALDSYLARNGEAFSSLKWRFQKLARLHAAPSGLYERAWELKAPGARDAGTYLSLVASFAAELGMGVYESWSLDRVPLQKIGTSRGYAIAGEAYVVQDRRFLYSIDAETAAAFELLDAGPADRAGVARELTGRFDLSEADAQATAREAIASLQVSSLVRAY
jgi:hypothetical protein